MTWLSPTLSAFRWLLIRKPVTACCWRWTRSAQSRNPSAPTNLPRKMGGAPWSLTALEKPRMLSLPTSLLVCPLDRYKLLTLFIHTVRTSNGFLDQNWSTLPLWAIGQIQPDPAHWRGARCCCQVCRQNFPPSPLKCSLVLSLSHLLSLTISRYKVERNLYFVLRYVSDTDCFVISQ